MDQLCRVARKQLWAIKELTGAVFTKQAYEGLLAWYADPGLGDILGAW